jgi:hypothetical protein
MTSMPSTPAPWSRASRSPTRCITRSGGFGGSCFASRVAPSLTSCRIYRPGTTEREYAVVLTRVLLNPRPWSGGGMTSYTGSWAPAPLVRRGESISVSSARGRSRRDYDWSCDCDLPAGP